MTSDSHVLVTGATGFLGSYILRTLLQRGYTRISALRRQNSRMGLVSDIQEQITWIEADLFDFDILSSTMKDIDVVIHSAAIIAFANRDFDEMFKVNVEGTAHMVNAALENDVQQFLHISSIAALGRSTESPRINEQTEFTHSKLDSGYGLTKHLAEREVWRGGSEGLRVTIINPSMIMGAGYWDTGTAKIVDTVARRLRYYPKGATGFVDVRDVARMSILMLEQDCMNRRMICCAENFKIRRMIEMICTGLDQRPPSIALTPFLRGIAWRGEWIRARLTNSRQLITKQTLTTSASDFTFDNQKSIDELNFNYTPLTETMRETCTLYRISRANQIPYAVLPL